MSEYKVIDVSYWQGSIDWAKVKKSGVVGAIIRYADGNTLDSKFAYNMKNARANGIHVGAYIYSRSTTKAGAEDEAKRIYNAAKKFSPDMPLYIDMEWNGQAKYANTIASAYLSKIKSLGGKGGIYANLNWFNNYITASKFTEYPLWIAQYNSRITYKNPGIFGMWQYSSSGKVSGISGRVDMNKCYVAYWSGAAAASKAASTTTAKTEETTTMSKSVLTVDGIAGKLTIKALQSYLGTVKDGEISGQRESLKKYFPALTSVCTYSGKGSACIKALQKKLGVTQDGLLGPATVREWQKKLGVTADGIFGKNSVKALQQFLNGEIFTAALSALASEITKNKFKYYADCHYQSYAASLKGGKTVNCAKYVSWALQTVGVLPTGKTFWLDTSIHGGGADTIKKNCAVSYPKKAPKNAGLKVGDICGYKTHTQVFAGWNAKGKPLWYSVHPSSVKSGKIAKIRRLTYDTKKIQVLIRIK